MEFFWKLVSTKRLRTAMSQSPHGSSSSPMLGNFNTRRTAPSTSPAITPNTLSWKRSRLWFENTANSKSRKNPNEFLEALLRHSSAPRRRGSAEIHRDSGILGAQEEALQVFGPECDKKRSLHHRRREHPQAI